MDDAQSPYLSRRLVAGRSNGGVLHLLFALLGLHISSSATADRVDVSSPEVVHAYLTSPTAWSCRQLRVWKDFRYWIFDCGEALSPLSPEAVRRP